MTWTYSGVPGTSERDEVRFWTQDVVEDRPLLSDEEIDYLLDKWMETANSVIYVAAVAAEVIAGKLAGEVAVSADGVSVNLSELQDKYMRLAIRLRDQAKLALDQAIDLPEDIHTHNAMIDASLEPLVFGIGFMDNWEAGRADYGNYKPGRARTSYGGPPRELTGED